MKPTSKLEQRIESWVERQIDRLDAKYTKGNLTDEEYEAGMKNIKLAVQELYDAVTNHATV